MTSRVCTFSAVENAATVPTTVTYRASFAGNIDFAPTTSALLRVSILPTLQTEVAVELSTPQALVGIRYNVNAHISYIDESNSVFPLIDAQVLIYTYVPTPTEPAMLPSYMLTDIVHTDLNGKVTLGFIEQMQLRRFIRVVVPDQTINGTRYNGCTTSPDMVFNVRNPLSLITAPLVGGSVPVMDQVLAAQFAYKQAHQ